MNKKMDANFAFAILLLVAAIVGMYFWLDKGSVDIEDIYQDKEEVKVQSTGSAKEMEEGDVDEMEEEKEAMKAEMQK